MSIIVGIAGPSRAGKTFLARLISEHSTSLRVKTLHQDEFVKPIDQIPLINGHVDWESPESVDFPRYRRAILEDAGQPGIVIAEGLLSFYDPGIMQLFDRKIFISLSCDEFKYRKRTDLRWGKEPEWYINHIWKSYLRFGQCPANIPNMMRIDGESDFIIEKVMDFIGS